MCLFIERVRENASEQGAEGEGESQEEEKENKRVREREGSGAHLKWGLCFTQSGAHAHPTKSPFFYYHPHPSYHLMTPQQLPICS